jgi:ABC-type iron transport system FetAB permease component
LGKVLVVNKDNVVLDFIQVGYRTDVSALLVGFAFKVIYHFGGTNCIVITLKIYLAAALWFCMKKLNQTEPATFSILPFWTFFRDFYFLNFIATLALLVPRRGCKKSPRTFNLRCYISNP